MAGVEQSVLYMKVTDALREPGPGKLAELSKVYNISDFPGLLTLAVELSPLETFRWVANLYETKGRDLNEVDPKSGDTALHKAVQSSREAIVRELMLNARVDDTVRNKAGLTAPDLASSSEMEHAISASENKFAEKIAVRLKSAFKNHDIAELQQIYANPRVSVNLNINGIDPDTGRTVLHDSAQANDVKLVQFILAHGGDPLVRDRSTRKLAEELTTNDEIRKILNNAAKSKAILDQTHGGSKDGAVKAPPKMEGYLKKWTNITSGYKLRWFVLKNGELCYYKHPEDAKKGERLIRGSVGLRHAIVKLDSSEKNKFEIRTPSTRFHLKASHPAETNKWVWALQNAITFVRDEQKNKQSTSNEQPRAAAAAPSGGGLSPAAAAAVGSDSQPQGNAPQAAADAASINTTDGALAAKMGSNSSTKSRSSYNGRHARSATASTEMDGWIVNDLNTKGDGDEDDSDDDYADEAALRGPQISAESLIARLSAIKDLMTLLVFQVQDETMRDAITTAQGSVDVVSSDIVMFQRQAQANLHKLKVELERSDKAQRNWASNYRDLQVQYDNLEGQLHTLKKNGGAGDRGDDEDDDDEFFDTVESAAQSHDHSHSDPSRAAGSTDSTNEPQQVSHQSESNVEPERAPEDMPQQVPQHDPSGSASSQQPSEPNAASSNASGHGGAAAAAGAGAGAAGVAGAAGTTQHGQNQQPSQQDSPQNHEQQQAPPSQEGGTPSQGGSAANDQDLTEVQQKIEQRIEGEKSFAGYEDPPRTKLALDADNRPKLSLWGILKNLIGKDMTKMTLPVTFNECTSLLQRSAEDMEYVELLDRAAEAVDDEGLRMAYIAAFAGSSYSSTINRIAKPFNPLLGETYEYARPDKGYRLFAEQVSHHPPIGALIAESKHWDFYGESNVESKFYGRSFDINPLGLWYINLRPDKGANVENEIYSFRKLTSSVVGIMLGNPVVDNYGDMKITNHTTGTTAVISYKARGWRGSSAYKLQGKITDKSGKELWSIAGQWNDKIWAKKAGSDEKILLWTAHERHKIPFNLTDFAVTLNALPEKLKPWLPPTDTRLRPDQRAMEEGRYDDASDEKARVEDKQRQRRRERETKGIEYKPQWFTLEKHPVTGLNYYKPINDYWKQRAEHQLADKGDIF